MRRREVLAIVGGAATWPMVARAQQPAVPVIGFLHSGFPIETADRLPAFRRALSHAGFDEGRNVMIEFRWAEGRNDQLPAFATDLVRRPVTVIAAIGTTAALAAKKATTSIPTVFLIGANPIEIGLVASLSHPGGNVTGVTNLHGEVGPKRLELLHEVVPKAAAIAVLLNPTNPALAEALSRDLRAAAGTLGRELLIVYVSNDRDVEKAFASFTAIRVGAVMIGADAFFNSRGAQLGALAMQHRLPAIFQYREFAVAGGLMSYGGSLADVYRHLAFYTGRILKGEKPADLPVQQTTKMELIINLKSAKALGITMPLSLLGRADEVIE